MDINLEQELLRKFNEAAGGQPTSPEVAEDTDDLLAHVSDFIAPKSDSPEHPVSGPSSPGPDDGVFGQSASYMGSSSRSEALNDQNDGGGATAGSIVTTLLEGGLGVVPLITGLIGLFGGGSTSPAPLEKYEMPSAISFTSADVGDGLAAADFDQMGTPRVYASSTAGQSGSGSPIASGDRAAPGIGMNSTPATVTVNVQTMDARSFLDNSDQIAQAVRGAMLNLSSINDVVSELS